MSPDGQGGGGGLIHWPVTLDSVWPALQQVAVLPSLQVGGVPVATQVPLIDCAPCGQQGGERHSFALSGVQ